MRHVGIVCFLVSVLASVTAGAQDYDKGTQAYYDGDYPTAMRELRAYSGDREVGSAYLIGEMFRLGKGVEVDIEEAAFWYRKSAEAGHVRAPFYLGEIYLKGEDGVPRSIEKGIGWWCVAGNRNNNLAKELLVSFTPPGGEYESICPEIIGWRNEVEDQKEFIVAAEKGDAEAQFQLAEMYSTGKGAVSHGIEMSSEEAEKWYRKAAEQGHSDAQFKLALMYYHGDRMGGHLTTDYRQAYSWFMKSAKQGHANSQKWLSHLYSNGSGVIKDQIVALMWLHVASSILPNDERGSVAFSIRKLESELSPSQRNDAIDRAKSCLRSDFQSCN